MRSKNRNSKASGRSHPAARTGGRVFDKHALQHARPGKTGEAEVVIGLDFGTSASKVVIQVPGLPGDPAFAVDFGDVAHPSMRYLLPTRLWVTPNGACTLRGQPPARLVNDIKLELITKDDHLKSNHGPSRQGLSAEDATVAYLALVLRRAREWFLAAKHNVVGHLAKLNWSVNLGVPSPCIENNEENRRFQRVGKAAWMLSVLENQVTIAKARDELRHLTESPEYWERDDDGLACDFDIVPEIAAGAIGYASSTLRREGLHLMVDVGASTLDVCSFVLHERAGNDRYSLLTADVKQLGTLRLHQERILAIQKAHEGQAQDLRDKHDPLAPITEDLEPYLLSRDRILGAMREAEGQLKKTCQMMLRRVVLDLRKQRDPNASVWRGRLPIILIGGGAQLPFFRMIVEEMNEWVASNIGRSEGTVLLPVNIPVSVSTNALEQHRLAVAWGLSHQGFNIGEIIPADRIPDINPPRQREWEDRFVSNDQV
jgi:hypothetical protein